MERDYILCECEENILKVFVEELEPFYDIKVAKGPELCLTMIQAEDSVEYQEFYLGEALTSECEVAIQDKTGYGICLGDQPIRSYCIAVIDAVEQLEDERKDRIAQFLNNTAAIIKHNEEAEYNQILKTKVDFKLMEES